jgi:hypothetical protein
VPRLVEHHVAVAAEHVAALVLVDGPADEIEDLEGVSERLDLVMAGGAAGVGPVLREATKAVWASSSVSTPGGQTLASSARRRPWYALTTTS